MKLTVPCNRHQWSFRGMKKMDENCLWEEYTCRNCGEASYLLIEAELSIIEYITSPSSESMQ